MRIAEKSRLVRLYLKLNFKHDLGRDDKQLFRRVSLFFCAQNSSHARGESEHVGSYVVVVVVDLCQSQSQHDQNRRSLIDLSLPYTLGASEPLDIDSF